MPIAAEKTASTMSTMFLISRLQFFTRRNLLTHSADGQHFPNTAAVLLGGKATQTDKVYYVHESPSCYNRAPKTHEESNGDSTAHRLFPCEFLVAVGDEFPVDDFLKGFDVVGAAVLVFEVVGVLPHINAKERRGAGAERGVLVGGGLDGEFAVAEDEPCPAAAELLGGGVAEKFLPLGEGAEGFFDVAEEVALRAASVFFQMLPEEGVVVVAAAVVADGGADGFGSGVETGEYIFDGLAGEVGGFGDGFVEFGDVGGVVFVVVEFHGLRVDVGLQRVVVVWQGGEFKDCDGCGVLCKNLRACERGGGDGFDGGASGVHSFGLDCCWGEEFNCGVKKASGKSVIAGGNRCGWVFCVSGEKLKVCPVASTGLAKHEARGAAAP